MILARVEAGRSTKNVAYNDRNQPGIAGRCVLSDRQLHAAISTGRRNIYGKPFCRGVRSRYADRGRSGSNTNWPLRLLAGETETDRKADIKSRRRAGSPGRTFSWGGGSRGCPGVSERFRRIMKEWGGNAQGDRPVRCAWEKRVGRIDFRGD